MSLDVEPLFTQTNITELEGITREARMKAASRAHELRIDAVKNDYKRIIEWADETAKVIETNLRKIAFAAAEKGESNCEIKIVTKKFIFGTDLQFSHTDCIWDKESEHFDRFLLYKVAMDHLKAILVGPSSNNMIVDLNEEQVINGYYFNWDSLLRNRYAVKANYADISLVTITMTWGKSEDVVNKHCKQYADFDMAQFVSDLSEHQA